MSDYLQNLLTRSLTPSRVVQPRLASFFEPRFEASTHASAPFDFVNEEGEPRSSETTREGRADGRHGDAPPRVSFNPPRPEAAPLTSQAPPSDIETQPRSLQPVQSPLASHAREDAPRHALQTPPEARTTRAAEEKGRGEAREEHEGRAVEPKRDVTAPARVDDKHAPRVVEPQASQPYAPRVVEPRVVPAPSVSASRPSQFAESNERAISDEPPTVRVTIGRVDVRAVASPPQEKRRAPEPRRPALTLEDYLRRRGGGGR